MTPQPLKEEFTTSKPGPQLRAEGLRLGSTQRRALRAKVNLFDHSTHRMLPRTYRSPWGSKSGGISNSLRPFIAAPRDSHPVAMIMAMEGLFSGYRRKKLHKQIGKGHLGRGPGSTKISRGGGRFTLNLRKAKYLKKHSHREVLVHRIFRCYINSQRHRSLSPWRTDRLWMTARSKNIPVSLSHKQ